MSSAITIDGKNLLPIREVVGRTKYTRDYIARLAREGAIVGVQVGRQWFIDEVSLMRFAEASELEQQVRRRQLSQDRRRERVATETFKQEWDVVAKRSRYGARRALAHSVLVIAAGLCTGYALYAAPITSFVASVSQKAQAPLATLAVPSPGAVEEAALPAVTEAPLFIASEDAQRVVFVDESVVRALPASSTGILILPTGAVATSVEAVAALFSDPVSVTYDAAGVGTVHLATGASSTASTSLTFVTVPVEVADANEGVPPPTTP